MMKHGEIELIDGLHGYIDLATTEDAHRFSDFGTERGLIIFVPLAGAKQIDVDISIKEQHGIIQQREGVKKEK